jgi:hypothetical protein
LQALGDVFSRRGVREMVTSALSAGVTHGLTDKLAQLSGVNMNLTGKGVGFMDRVRAAGVQTAASLPAQVALTGDPLEALTGAMVQGVARAVGGHLSSRIGEAFHAEQIERFTQLMCHGCVGAGTSLLLGGDPASGAVGAVVAELVAGAYREGVFGNTPLDQNSPLYQDQVEYGIKVAKVVTALCVGYMGGDMNAALLAADNAARYNAMAVVYDPDARLLTREEQAEEDRKDRAKALKGIALRRAAPPTKRFHEGTRAGKLVKGVSQDLQQGVMVLYDGRAAFEGGERTPKSTSLLAGAYALDGVGYVFEGLDRLTCGVFPTMVGELLDDCAHFTGRVVGLGAGALAGDRVGHEFGDATTLALMAGNPLKIGAASKAGKLKNLTQINKAAARVETTALVSVPKPLSLQVTPSTTQPLSLQFALNARQYVREMEALSGIPFTQKQVDMLALALRSQPFTPLQGVEKLAHAKQYKYAKNNGLIAEWELNLGKEWPKYTQDRLNSNGGFLYRSGDDPSIPWRSPRVVEYPSHDDGSPPERYSQIWCNRSSTS